MNMRLQNEQNADYCNQWHACSVFREEFQPEYGDEVWECGMIGGIQQLSIDL